MATQSVSTWTPTSLGATLKAWYLSQYNATTGVWTSETGSNNTLGSISPPTATTINGNAAANFSVAQYVVVGTGLNTYNAGLLSDSYTVWCVCEPTAFLLGAGTLISRCVSVLTDGPERGMALSIGSYAITELLSHWNNRANLVSGSSPLGAFADPTDLYNYRHAVVDSTRLRTGTPYSLIATYNATSQPMQQLFLNGRLVATSTSSNGSMSPPLNLAMLVIGAAGSYASNAGNIYTINQDASYSGKIGNIGFCNSVLSGNDLNNLRWYLNDWSGVKWEDGTSGPVVIR